MFKPSESAPIQYTLRGQQSFQLPQMATIVSKQTFQNKEVYIVDKTGKISAQMEKVQSWECCGLSFNQVTSLTKIVQILGNISFKSLKKLTLNFDHVSSVEALAKLNAPGLQILNLDKNMISNTTPLIKIKSKKIREISLCCNMIQEMPTLPYSDFKQFSILKLQHFLSFGQIRYECHCIRFLTKMSRKQLEQWEIFIEAQKRIKELPVIEAIGRNMEKEKEPIFSLHC